MLAKISKYKFQIPIIMLANLGHPSASPPPSGQFPPASRRVSIFRLLFVIAYLLGIALQPWRIASAEEAGMSAIMLILMALWMAIGWIIGAIPTALILSIVRWASATVRKRT